MATIDTTGLALLQGEFVFPDGVNGAAFVATVWDFYQDKARLAPRLQYLYAKRHCAEMILKRVWQNVTWSEAGVSESLGQQFANTKLLYDAINAELLLLEKRIAANRGGAMGVIAKTAPIEPGPLQPDGNARIYRGDPLNRR